MNRKVIIRGYIFDYEEKAPFVLSGKSTLGALEYEPETDRTKCHECGEWARSLAHHVRRAHSLNRKDYNVKHGLRRSSALSGMKRRNNHSIASRAMNNIGKATATASAVAQAKRNTGGTRPAGPQLEVRNLNARCMAQVTFRLMTLAAQLGHTPTPRERKDAGLLDGMIARRFGNITNAMAAAALDQTQPRKVVPLRAGYPRTEEEIRESAERWSERMPWPSEYFDMAIIALERRRD